MGVARKKRHQSTPGRNKQLRGRGTVGINSTAALRRAYFKTSILITPNASAYGAPRKVKSLHTHRLRAPREITPKENKHKEPQTKAHRAKTHQSKNSSATQKVPTLNTHRPKIMQRRKLKIPASKYGF